MSSDCKGLSIREMSSDNKIILEAFCLQFVDLMTDLQNIYPNEEAVFKMKAIVQSVAKVDPKRLMMYWKHYVIGKYYAQIAAGDIDFFINKNYTDDLSSEKVQEIIGSKSDTILTVIDGLRDKLRGMTSNNKEKTVAYMQNLAKLSTMYKG